MRLVACLTMCLMRRTPLKRTHELRPTLKRTVWIANFYPYIGEPSKSGYQLGSGFRLRNRTWLYLQSGTHQILLE